MEIPLQAQVECTDGVCGQSAYVLINPVSEQVTHLVVKEAPAPQTEYIVPVELISTTVAGTIQLRCSQAELEKMEPFVQTRFIKEQVPEMRKPVGYGLETRYYWPYVKPEMKTIYKAVDDRQVPAGEMAVRRGTRVEATDGYVGHVDEFVVNSDNDHITHLVLREGHLWGKKVVIIPLSAMSDGGQDNLRLKLNKQQIGALPTFPLHRGWA